MSAPPCRRDGGGYSFWVVASSGLVRSWFKVLNILSSCSLLKKYFSGTSEVGTSTDDKDTLSVLRDTEVLGVENLPLERIPCLGHLIEYCGKVPSSVAAKYTSDILPDESSGMFFFECADVLVDKATSSPNESCALSGDTEILARASSDEQIKVGYFTPVDFGAVAIVFDIGVVVSEDCGGVGVNFGETNTSGYLLPGSAWRDGLWSVMLHALSSIFALSPTCWMIFIRSFDTDTEPSDSGKHFKVPHCC